MASGDDTSRAIEIMKSYASLATTGKNTTQITSKAMMKMVKDCWKEYKGLDTFVDTNGFPSCKDQGKPFMTLDKEHVGKFLGKCAEKCSKSPSDMVAKLKMAETSGTTKTSKTGGVDKMTDASQYTGSHKERFDKDGKGKGIDGRADRAANDGYVGAYNQKGTYDKKH